LNAAQSGVYSLCNFVDTDLGVVGTMTVFLAETFPSFHFEGNHFVSLHMVDDLGLDNGLYIFTNGQGVAMGQKDFTELNFITGVTRDAGNVQSLVLLDFELLSGYFNDC
jgi:hypothetical protein